MTMTQQHIVVTNNRRRNDVVVSGDTVDDLARDPPHADGCKVTLPLYGGDVPPPLLCKYGCSAEGAHPLPTDRLSPRSRLVSWAVGHDAEGLGVQNGRAGVGGV
jgi:hypothetical protein